MKSKQLIKLLEADGWQLIRVNGSHHIFKKDGVDELISISHPEKDVSRLQMSKAKRVSGLDIK